MSTIVAATDFSQTGNNAVQYAFELARHMQHRLLILNIYPDAFFYSESVYPISDDEIKDVSVERMQKLLKSLPANTNVPVDVMVLEGDVAETITHIAADENASWIVAGLHGHNTVAGKLFGSTAYTLSQQCHIPMMFVPTWAQFTPPGSIAFASDFHYDANLHLLDPLKTFAGHFASMVYMVRVVKSYMNEAVERSTIPTGLTDYLEGVRAAFHFVADDNVAHGISEFAGENRVDLIAMMSQEHSLLSRIFSRSQTRQMMEQSMLPLMIVPGIKAARRACAKDNSTCRSCPACRKRAEAAEVYRGTGNAHIH